MSTRKAKPPRKTVFTNRVRQAMKKKGMSQADLARSLESSESYVSHVLAGRVEPTLARARKIAKKVGLSITIN